MIVGGVLQVRVCVAAAVVALDDGTERSTLLEARGFAAAVHMVGELPVAYCTLAKGMRRMGGMKTLVLGEPIDLTGDITKNTWVGARSARELERSLGYGQGRLSAGWWILVLKQKLAPDDFIFSGITLRSGGRYGLPADDLAADRLRPHVHDVMLKEYGSDNVTGRKTHVLSEVSYQGPDRLVKIVPITPHSETAKPSKQYPMGGGGLQWTLIKPCRFFAAVRVDENGIARTPNFSMFLGESVRYEDRAKLAKYLENV